MTPRDRTLLRVLGLERSASALGVLVRREFFRQVQKRAPGGCWLWTGRTRGPYGMFWWGGGRHYAHTLAWTLRHGTPPDGPLRHDCQQPLCVRVRPGHVVRDTSGAGRRRSRKRAAAQRASSLTSFTNTPPATLAAAWAAEDRP